MTVLTSLAPFLAMALASPAQSSLSGACANDPTLFNAAILPDSKVNSLFRYYPNKDLTIDGVGSPSFAMSGKCVGTLRGVAKSLVLDNGRGLWVTVPPLKLVPDPATEPYKTVLRPSPINAELRLIDGSSVGSSKKLVYVDSVYVNGHKRIGLWTNKAIWAVETVTCEREVKCARPIPLLSSKNPIKQIGYIGSPDSTGGGQLILWVGGEAGAEYSVRIALSGA